MANVPAANSKPPKNIVICIDGTGDWSGWHETNVFRIFQRVNANSGQVKFYTGGVGTLANSAVISASKRTFLQLLDLATATGLHDQVLDAYQFLIDHYEPNDNIYLFGFSRGAFVCRALAAIVYRFGILPKQHENLAKYAWQVYSSVTDIDEFKTQSDKFKTDFCSGITPRIRFMGLFDTVSSVGVFTKFKIFPYSDFNPIVQHVRHAVSIHESRNGFPELLIKPCNGQVVKEIWFPGVHRDVGGGEDKDPGYERNVLEWMLNELSALNAQLTGMGQTPLQFDATPLQPAKARIHTPMFDPYVFVGLYPQRMFDYSLDLPALKQRQHRKNKDTGFRYFWPNFKHFRKIPEGANVAGAQGVGENTRTMTALQLNESTTKYNKSFADVRNVLPPRHTPTLLSKNKPEGIIEFIGTFLGVLLSFLMLNRGLFGIEIRGWTLPYFWPECAAWWAGGMFFAYLVHQGFSAILEMNPMGKRLNRIVPILGGAIGIAAITNILSHAYRNTLSPTWFNVWPALWIGILFAIITATISIFAPVRSKTSATPSVAPILAADRTVGIVFVPWFFCFAGFYLFSQILVPLWNCLLGFFFDAHWSWLEWDGFRLAAWIVAMFTFVFGLYKIWVDRQYKVT